MRRVFPAVISGCLLAAIAGAQDIDRLAVVDPQDDHVAAQYPVAGCRGNHGIALAPEQRHAFLVCEDNHLLAVFDLQKHAVTQTIPLPGGGDVVKATRVEDAFS